MAKSDQEKAEIRRQTEARRQPDKDRTAHERERGVKRSVPVGSLSTHISRRELDDSELKAAMKEFQAGSDRVAAIMGAALVESQLMDTIREALKEPFDDNVLFHDQGAPFGTLRAKIVAGRALGLYDENIARDLDIIRDIRNQFAHALMSFDFDHPMLVKYCKKFSEKVITDGSGNPLPFEGYTGGGSEISETRRAFEVECWKLSIILLKRGNEILKIKHRNFKGWG
ncbi:hypothetical protein [Aurantiacibacter flavus]|uniref:Mannitol repressor n=1 Tax=Aurantiacibacter flavus TaxID=3145232 RepID=A0ABV0D226_9SPHN